MVQHVSYTETQKLIAARLGISANEIFRPAHNMFHTVFLWETLRAISSKMGFGYGHGYPWTWVHRVWRSTQFNCIYNWKGYFWLWRFWNYYWSLYVSSIYFCVALTLTWTCASAIAHSVPLRLRPIYNSTVGALECIASIVAPVIGGALTTYVSWRWW